MMDCLSFHHHVLLTIASAVSSQAVHKIQSSSGPLDMRLAQVPKMLLVLRKDWAPKAFCISFKVIFTIKQNKNVIF